MSPIGKKAGVRASERVNGPALRGSVGARRDLDLVGDNLLTFGPANGVRGPLPRVEARAVREADHTSTGVDYKCRWPRSEDLDDRIGFHCVAVDVQGESSVLIR